MAGTERGFKHQLLKACFEEAKTIELSTIINGQPTKLVQERTGPCTNYANQMNGSQQGGAHDQPPQTNGHILDSDQCHKCRMPGHFQRDCPYSQPHKATETRGSRNNQPVGQVAAVPASGQHANGGISNDGVK